MTATHEAAPPRAQLVQRGGPEADVEAAFGIKVATLRWYRRTGGGPPYCQPGGPHGRITYLFADVEAWLESHRVAPEAP